jgi:multiple sugar transport system substrate-binding protein
MANSQYPEEAMRFAVWLNTNLDSVNLLIKGGYGWQALDNAYHRTILAARSPRRRRPPPLSAVPGPVRR